jgi:hypothetical protein
MQVGIVGPVMLRDAENVLSGVGCVGYSRV